MYQIIVLRNHYYTKIRLNVSLCELSNMKLIIGVQRKLIKSVGERQNGVSMIVYGSFLHSFSYSYMMNKPTRYHYRIVHPINNLHGLLNLNYFSLSIHIIIFRWAIYCRVFVLKWQNFMVDL